MASEPNPICQGIMNAHKKVVFLPYSSYDSISSRLHNLSKEQVLSTKNCISKFAQKFESKW